MVNHPNRSKTEQRTQKAEHDFFRVAVNDIVTSMKPALVAASEAAHKLKSADAEGDDGYSDFDRTVELGFLVDTTRDLCGAHLALLNEIADALHGIEIGTPHRQ